MKSIKILLATVVLTMSALPTLAQNNSSGNGGNGNTTITIPTKPIKGEPLGPLDPSQSPLTCTLMGDCLSVFCHYDVMGEVAVTNSETLETVTSGSCNLGEGVILTLGNYTPGAMTLTVTISDTEYVGYF